MKKLLSVFIFVLIFCNCKDNLQEQEGNNNPIDVYPIEHPYRYGQTWKFYKSENSDSNSLPLSIGIVSTTFKFDIPDYVNIIILDSDRIYFGNLDDNQIKKISKFKDMLLFSGYRYKYFENSYYNDPILGYLHFDLPMLEIYSLSQSLNDVPDTRMCFSLLWDTVDGKYRRVLGVSPYPGVINYYFYLMD
jgi:hypothetical protein